MMNKRYKQILVDAEEFLEHVDADEFLDTFLELQENCSGPTIDEFLRGHKMEVYTVGEFCQHEGAGWSLLVADNENTFANIQKVLIDHHQEQITRYEGWIEERDAFEWQKDIDGHQKIIDLVKNAKSIEDFNNKEIPPWNHDVIRIGKQKIID